MAIEDGEKDWAPLAVALGTRVSQERERHGLSKEALALRSGLASRYIWRVEDGRQNITLAALAKIAGGLGIKLAELMAGVEDLVKRPVPKVDTKPRGASKKRVG